MSASLLRPGSGPHANSPLLPGDGALRLTVGFGNVRVTKRAIVHAPLRCSGSAGFCGEVLTIRGSTLGGAMVFKSSDDAITFASGKAGGLARGWSWRSVALVLVLVAGSMVASAAGSTASTGSTTATTAFRARSLPATQVHRVSPLTPNGHLRPGYHVTKHHPARCFGHSWLNGQTYHCENGVEAHEYDPCWKFSARSVVCLRNPWDRTLVRLHLKKIGRAHV